MKDKSGNILSSIKLNLLIWFIYNVIVVIIHSRAAYFIINDVAMRTGFGSWEGSQFVLIFNFVAIVMPIGIFICVLLSKIINVYISMLWYLFLLIHFILFDSRIEYYTYYDLFAIIKMLMPTSTTFLTWHTHWMVVLILFIIDKINYKYKYFGLLLITSLFINSNIADSNHF